MKRNILSYLLASLLLTALAVHTAAAQQEGSRAEKSPKKAISISGIVGSEGRFLVSDKGNRVWKVLNPELLTASMGRRVTVKARANAETSEITIRIVRLQEERTTAKLDDVAFRR